MVSVSWWDFHLAVDGVTGRGLCRVAGRVGKALRVMFNHPQGLWGWG